MDWLPTMLDFLARLIEAAAWPGALVITALIFRKEIRDIAGNLRSLKWGDKEAILKAWKR
ncbi:hypothetical protein DL239_12740 [Sedimentitalea sp. CY04]|uniref:Uncharacterized protein n=2 Tax=Parasedimentitalea denitrificans TaxID=2211118 RepID=A0ABX0W860_9RHOB|nr:hypothetical protein [Sedimentitalea sp. CY04]